ncbi:5'-nucleotidase domain-containing protein 1-like [Stegodyphus dumicola]|uniref:5'-nucleotidase domain-containing protein 1-like n=1 Tax=Stegodyphus dumicola TaxID=202533 RepID=UPI0015A98129|nr:5'-nucleotidase domain-containing protein 1-like [Stegodyphus dumicola]
MFTFNTLRLSLRICRKNVYRSNSTKLTFAQSMCPQEFCLESYDCIGFDLDHTICQYKLKPLISLIYKTLASFLIDKYDYPRCLASATEAEMAFAQKGIVLDKRKGNFLKLDNQYKIVKASHGTRLLSDEDICKIYGLNRIWEESKGIPHKLVSNTALDESFYVFKDYFVTAGAVICAKIVDILDEKHGEPAEEYHFWEHFLDGLFYMYERNNFKNNSGEFFPDLKKYPDLYVEPCSENVKRWLREIAKHKITFLLTSSNYDSAAFLAEHSLGKDWKQYFDIIITFARKPGFFWKDKPFCIINENTEVSGVKPEDMKRHLIYSQGNWKHLQEVCSILSKTKDPKMLYFGDSLIEDVYAASEIARWDIVAIVEEMLAEGMDNVQELHSESQTLVSKYWGSFFVSEERKGSPSLWTHLLSQYSRLTIPNLGCISGVQMQDKIPCFGSDMLFSGFFPGTPKALASS